MTAHPIPLRAPIHHGTRDTASALPAGGAARPISSAGRADPDFGRDYGTMGPEWIADQIRRADGDTRPAMQPVQPVDYDAPRYADLRDGGLMPREPMGWPGAIFWGVALGFGLAFWACIGGPALFWLFDQMAGWL